MAGLSKTERFEEVCVISLFRDIINGDGAMVVQS
jgi:hypothetical protein